MASQGYRDWLKAGMPYALIRPAAAVQATLRGYGLIVYDKPNEAHLTASTPEDHTPFSVTSWPVKNARWRGHALDVMPRNDSAAARKENADIARQLIRDRDAGVPGAMWIKYINWTDEHGACQQVRWMDDDRPLVHTTRSSSDRGHIHISGRSDRADDDRADGYDPTGGSDMTPLESAKLDAIYNAKRTTKLPGNNEAVFTVPLVARLDGIEDKLDTLAARVGVPVEGEVLEAIPTELSDAEVDRIAEAVAGKLAARLQS